MVPSNSSLDDLIPPDVPVRDTSGRVFCNKQCAASAGILSRDMAIITWAERHEKQRDGTFSPVAKYIGFCAHCGTMI